jgi:hypothetical protein
MVLGMTTTYFVLAPETNTIPGLGLGSTGLTLKMVGIQVVSANLIAFAIARMNGWRFDWIFQPLSLGVCVGTGWLAHLVVSSLVPHAWPLLVRIIPAGSLYCAIIITALFWLPGLVGSTRDEYRRDMRRMSSLVTRWRTA